MWTNRSYATNSYLNRPVTRGYYRGRFAARTAATKIQRAFRTSRARNAINTRIRRNYAFRLPFLNTWRTGGVRKPIASRIASFL